MPGEPGFEEGLEFDAAGDGEWAMIKKWVWLERTSGMADAKVPGRPVSWTGSEPG